MLDFFFSLSLFSLLIQSSFGLLQLLVRFNCLSITNHTRIILCCFKETGVINFIVIIFYTRQIDTSLPPYRYLFQAKKENNLIVAIQLLHYHTTTPLHYTTTLHHHPISILQNGDYLGSRSPGHAMGQVQGKVHVQPRLPSSQNQDDRISNRHDSVCVFGIRWNGGSKW